MKSRKVTVLVLNLALLAVLSSRSGAAQGPPPPPPGPGGPDVMYFAGGRAGFIGMMEMNDEVVTGYPYSAQANTETVQTLFNSLQPTDGPN